MRQRISRRKLVAFRTLAVLIPTLIGAGVVVYLQWFRPVYLDESIPEGFPPTRHRFVYDELLGWRNVSGFRSQTFGKPLSINSLGLRGRESSPTKPPGTSRILILGDSYAWGYGVADEEVISHKLEERLTATAEVPWEVLNAAVVGWGTDQEYLYLRRAGLELDPDVVVLALFLLNDPINNVTSGSTNWYKPVFRNSDLKDLEFFPCPKPNRGAPTVWTGVDPIEMTVALLNLTAQVCREHGCTLVVMKFGGYLKTDPTIPWLPAPRPYGDIELEFQRQFLPHVSEEERLYYVDLDREFLERGLDESQVQSQQTSHWTPLGHQVAAEVLYELLESEDIVRTRTAPAPSHGGVY
ncbi:MAG: SGNH/GDSL hydrolase family protein [Planctomycetales bacterium]